MFDFRSQIQPYVDDILQRIQDLLVDDQVHDYLLICHGFPRGCSKVLCHFSYLQYKVPRLVNFELLRIFFSFFQTIVFVLG